MRDLPELQLMTMSWLIIYATKNDINSIAILHMMFNSVAHFGLACDICAQREVETHRGTDIILM